MTIIILKFWSLMKNKFKIQLLFFICAISICFKTFIIEYFLNIKYYNQEYRKEMKYILRWPGESWWIHLSEGQTDFLSHKCPVNNCYIALNNSLFGDDMSKFHSILFFGPNLVSHKNIHDNLPLERYQHQKYVYMNTESAHGFPICTDKFNGYFNWTFTYRLDSDSIFQYLYIRDAQGKYIGPRKNMNWIENMNEVNETIVDKLRSKKKIAAWFVSHCKTRSHREDYVKKLQKALLDYNLTVDIYGRCGKLFCPKLKKKCGEILEKKYFFYLAFENSFADDYVTEKIMHAFDNTVVPVVYGGANYSRFLPPGSYIDARIQSPAQLARTMRSIMNNITLYSQYFWWKSYYTYSDGFEKRKGLCDFCKMLNDDAKFKTVSVYDDIRKWWYPNYKEVC